MEDAKGRKKCETNIIGKELMRKTIYLQVDVVK